MPAYIDAYEQWKATSISKTIDANERFSLAKTMATAPNRDIKLAARTAFRELLDQGGLEPMREVETYYLLATVHRDMGELREARRILQLGLQFCDKKCIPIGVRQL